MNTRPGMTLPIIAVPLRIGSTIIPDWCVAASQAIFVFLIKWLREEVDQVDNSYPLALEELRERGVGTRQKITILDDRPFD